MVMNDNGRELVAHGTESPMQSLKAGTCRKQSPLPPSTCECPMRTGENEENERRNGISLEVRPYQLLTSPSSCGLKGQRGKRFLEESNSFATASPRDSKSPRLDEAVDFDVMANDPDDQSSVVFVTLAPPIVKNKRKSRPFSASQIVPDWVPSKGLQVASKNFDRDSKWDIGFVGGGNSCGKAPRTKKTPRPKISPIPKSISTRRACRKTTSL